MSVQDFLPKAYATIAALEKRIEELEAVQFTPTGDNHHNALKCPYCNPEQIDPVAERKRIKELEAAVKAWKAIAEVNASDRDAERKRREEAEAILKMCADDRYIMQMGRPARDHFARYQPKSTPG